MAGDIRVGRAQMTYPDAAEVYVGRANGPYRLKASPLANPFKLKDYAREDMLGVYADWLRGKLDTRDPAVLAELDRIADLAREGPVVLKCWCRNVDETEPACHGDVVRAAVLRRLEQR
jgi:hypothetical protein